MPDQKTPPDEPLPIEGYALIGDCKSSALVGINGSIDWLCWPRFDSGACFAALLGNSNHGRWRIGPSGKSLTTTRRYLNDTVVLETLFETESGIAALIDFMPMNQPGTSIIRIIEGRQGRVSLRMDLTLRFDYGSTIPWVSKLEGDYGNVAIAGPNLIVLRTNAELRGEGMSTVSDFEVSPKQRIAFVLSYGASHKAPPAAIDYEEAFKQTVKYWGDWAARCTYTGKRRDIVVRSLLTLKAMTFAETGAVVAAPTTSLPERLGGPRNWDYRFCWVRDATLTLLALMVAGYYEEAAAWRDWLNRAVAGTPEDLQMMYGIFGQRRLAEWEVDWLPGYLGSAPVRVGNAASGQLQLDVWGEMCAALHLVREGGLGAAEPSWAMQRAAVEHLADIWNEPDNGIWEVRGPRQHFTHSKIMAWVAFDRSIMDAEKHSLDAPLEKWRAIRDEIRRTVLERGFSTKKQAFTQAFGSEELDASLLLISRVGFLPIEDPRVTGTIAAIERELVVDGLVLRYRSESGTDGLPAGEGIFIPCSFWLVNAYRRQGREAEAEALLERLLSLCNDVGLLSEEYDTRARRQLGNFPQAFSHMALVQTVLNVHGTVEPATGKA